jgi:hypothetical protein
MRGAEQGTVIAEGFAGGDDVYVERVVLDVNARPDLLHELLFGDQLAPGARECFQHVERAPAYRHDNAIPAQLALTEVQRPVAMGKGLRRSFHIHLPTRGGYGPSRPSSTRHPNLWWWRVRVLDNVTSVERDACHNDPGTDREEEAK